MCAHFSQVPANVTSGTPSDLYDLRRSGTPNVTSTTYKRYIGSLPPGKTIGLQCRFNGKRHLLSWGVLSCMRTQRLGSPCPFRSQACTFLCDQRVCAREREREEEREQGGGYGAQTKDLLMPVTHSQATLATELLTSLQQLDGIPRNLLDSLH